MKGRALSLLGGIFLAAFYITSMMLSLYDSGESLVVRSSSGGGLYIAPNPNYVAPPTCTSADPLNPVCYPTLDHSQESANIGVTDISTHIYANSGAIPSTKTLQLNGSANERVVGQVIINAATNLTNLSISVSALTGNRTGFVLSTQTVTAPSAPVKILVSSYQTTNILSATSTATNGYEGIHGGMIPAGQISHIDDLFGQVTDAMPINLVPAGRNQGFDIVVDITTDTPSDVFSGTFSISTGGPTPIATHPITLKVWSSSMPSTPSLMVYNEGGYGALCKMQYGGPTSTGCKQIHGQAADDNDGARIESVMLSVTLLNWFDGPGAFNQAGDTAATAFSKVGYLIQGTTSSVWPNPQHPGAKINMAKIALQSANQATCTSWLSQLRTLAPTGKWFPGEYSCDECSQSTLANQAASSMTAITAVGCPALITSDYATMSAAGILNLVNNVFVTVQNIKGNGALYPSFLAVNPSSNSFGGYTDCLATNLAGGNGTGSCNGPRAANMTGQGTGYPNWHGDGRAHNAENMGYVLAISSATGDLNSSPNLCWTTNTCGPSSYGNASASQTWSADGLAYKGVWDEDFYLPGVRPLVAISTPIFVPLFNAMSRMKSHYDYEYAMKLKAAGGATAQILFTQAATYMADIDNINEDPYKPSGSFTGSYTSADQAIRCAVHRQYLGNPAASCGT